MQTSVLQRWKIKNEHLPKKSMGVNFESCLLFIGCNQVTIFLLLAINNMVATLKKLLHHVAFVLLQWTWKNLTITYVPFGCLPVIQTKCRPWCLPSTLKLLSCWNIQYKHFYLPSQLRCVLWTANTELHRIISQCHEHDSKRWSQPYCKDFTLLAVLN